MRKRILFHWVKTPVRDTVRSVSCDSASRCAEQWERAGMPPHFYVFASTMGAVIKCQVFSWSNMKAPLWSGCAGDVIMLWDPTWKRIAWEMCSVETRCPVPWRDWESILIGWATLTRQDGGTWADKIHYAWVFEGPWVRWVEVWLAQLVIRIVLVSPSYPLVLDHL